MGKKELDRLKLNSIKYNTNLALNWLVKSGIQNNDKNRPSHFGAFNAWYDVKNSLSTYDGLFYDTYGDNHNTHFSSSLSSMSFSISYLDNISFNCLFLLKFFINWLLLFQDFIAHSCTIL